MALLHYQNLADHRPDVLMSRTFFGLKGHNDYLDRIKKHLESDNAVLRLAVRKSAEPEQDKGKKHSKRQDDASVWVELAEPEDLKEVSDKVFESFLDNDVKSVYETGVDTAEELSSAKHKRKDKKFIKSREIRVLGKNPKTEQLLLERMPVGDILLRPNTYTIEKQLEAIRKLQNSPSQSHRPLLRLFEDTRYARWLLLSKEFKNQCFKEELDPDTGKQRAVPNEKGLAEILNWKVLTDGDRSGTTEQRLFVATALNTPDFALLEGPPGSGKTTAICELIIQLILQGKRVLLCASTHVAVDNVIERLMDEDNQHRHLVIPLRIGKDDSVSERVAGWTLGQFVKTESDRIKHHLNQQELSGSQSLLKQNLQNDSSLVERMVLNSANLVCGTTIGLLQHPDIKNNKSTGSPQFDVMIIDEASKTTFQEFLVPALHAKCWILVGDPKQLSPYVDDQELALNIAPCLQQEAIRDACADVFMGKQRPGRNRRTSVIEIVEGGDLDIAAIYERQAAGRDVLLKRALPEPSLGYASIVIGTRQDLQRSEEYLPLDTTIFRLANDKSRLPIAESRSTAYISRQHLKLDGNPSWENEISWRLTRLYEQRFAPEKADSESKKTTQERLTSDLSNLMPVSGIAGIDISKVEGGIDLVRRVALPSVLECLRLGFERNARDLNGSALTDGLPDDVIAQRRVLLSYQHRMHPEIAEFSHQYVYHKEALISPDDMAVKRFWDYPKYASRAVWIDVKGKPGKKTANKAEADEIMKQLQKFDRWSRSHSNNGKPWEVAILSFYRGQEYELQQHLQDWTKSKSRRHFHRGDKNIPYLSIQLCTVDRFQGHEADLVFLSFSNDHVTSFLESPNRLNVALTRAKYQLVIVGNRQKLKESNSLVGKLASISKWSANLENQ